MGIQDVFRFQQLVGAVRHGPCGEPGLQHKKVQCQQVAINGIPAKASIPGFCARQRQSVSSSCHPRGVWTDVAHGNIVEGLGEVTAKGIKADRGYGMESLHIQDDGTGACLTPESICRRSPLKLFGHLQP